MAAYAQCAGKCENALMEINPRNLTKLLGIFLLLLSHSSTMPILFYYYFFNPRLVEWNTFREQIRRNRHLPPKTTTLLENDNPYS